MALQKVVLQRSFMSPRCTLGSLTIIGHRHDPIFTLEEPWKFNQQFVSCIPPGEYLVRPHFSDKYHGRDDSRYSDDAYVLAHVPGREAVLIHVGNTLLDTEGCILIGTGNGKMNGRDAVTASQAAMAILLKAIGRQDFSLQILNCPAQIPIS